ncbi:MAG TPA: hypothetical protein VF323_04845 [Candidatus Limnocylindrales bacterium]
MAVATDRTVLRWQAHCIEALAAVPGVAIERWVRNAAAQGASGGRSGARGTIEVPDALRRLSPVDGGSPEPAAPVPEGAVDVLLDLSGAGLASPVDWATETWHFGYGDTLARDPEQAARVDFIRHPGRSRVALIAEPGGRIVRDGLLSWWRGEELERILLDPSGWPATAALDRTDPVPEPAAPAGPVASSRRGPSRAAKRGVLEAAPGPVVRMATFGRRVQRAAASVVRHDGWNVGAADAPIERMLGPDAAYGITWLPARAGLFAADPFGIERDGVLHVFFEEYDQAAARGTISHVAIAEDGTIGDPEPVLDPGVHASYPFLVEDQGTTFMLPETSAAGELVLYAAADFPLHWRREVTLLPGVPAVDASVVRFEGRWWMFATRIDRGANHNLFVWHAPALTGPWTAHAANPVKTDSGSARPGGTPYIVDGKLFRPSQDDASFYGGAVVVNEVEVLTPRSFSERPVGTIRPKRGSPYPDGLHTLSAVGRRTLIDGNHLGFVKERFAIDVTRKLNAIRGRRA